jgi:exodeoxyribonuclease-1
MQLVREQWPFDDERLPELLFRYRARNFPETLSDEENARWTLFCQQRLTDAQWGAPNTLQDFDEAAAECSINATEQGLGVLNEWREYVEGLRNRLGL